MSTRSETGGWGTEAGTTRLTGPLLGLIGIVN